MRKKYIFALSWPNRILLSAESKFQWTVKPTFFERRKKYLNNYMLYFCMRHNFQANNKNWKKVTQNPRRSGYTIWIELASFWKYFEKNKSLVIDWLDHFQIFPNPKSIKLSIFNFFSMVSYFKICHDNFLLSKKWYKLKSYSKSFFYASPTKKNKLS